MALLYLTYLIIGLVRRLILLSPLITEYRVLGDDVSRLIHEGSSAVADQLLEHLERCKNEVLKVVIEASQRKRSHQPDRFVPRKESGRYRRGDP